jgi:hypothetical protein
MSKTIRRPAPRQQEKIESFRHARGVDRMVHFEMGGTPASWRGVRQVIPDLAKEESRSACRGIHAMDEDDSHDLFGPEDGWGDHLEEE